MAELSRSLGFEFKTILDYVTAVEQILAIQARNSKIR